MVINPMVMVSYSYGLLAFWSPRVKSNGQYAPGVMGPEDYGSLG